MPLLSDFPLLAQEALAMLHLPHLVLWRDISLLGFQRSTVALQAGFGQASAKYSIPMGADSDPLQLVAGAAVVVGAIVGIVKYTNREDDVEHHAKGVKGKLEKKGKP